MDDSLKRFAYSLVQKISRKIRREMSSNFYQMGRVVDLGADGTATLFIDKLAEDVALKAVKNAPSPINLLSEECGFKDFGGKYLFVLDPIDGTRNAYRGIPFYGISLAIGSETLQDLQYGIVKNIPTGDEFIAEKGKGAFLNNKPIAVCEHPPDNLVSSIMLGRHSTELAVSAAQKDIIRSLGVASLEMCLVAFGALDVYFVGKQDMRVVDIAAGTLIVREAGGVVTDADGLSLDMGLNLDERVSIIAASSLRLINKLLAGGKNRRDKR